MSKDSISSNRAKDLLWQKDFLKSTRSIGERRRSVTFVDDPPKTIHYCDKPLAASVANKNARPLANVSTVKNLLSSRMLTINESDKEQHRCNCRQRFLQTQFLRCFNFKTLSTDWCCWAMKQLDRSSTMCSKAHLIWPGSSHNVALRRTPKIRFDRKQTDCEFREKGGNERIKRKEMAKHIAECLEQLNTGLDKVLQARQLLESSQDLPLDDRETMLRLLNQAMRSSRKRLECTDDRYDPDGRHSDSPNSLPSQRPCAPLTPSSQQQTSTTFQANIDPAEFIKQHGPQLLALLQQNMAKQN